MPSRIKQPLRLLATALVILSQVAAAAPVPVGKPAHYPNWWFEQEVIKRKNTDVPPVWPEDYFQSDDFAAANAGQLKHIATKAFDELSLKIPNAVGTELGPYVTQIGANKSDGFTAVNLGQLKAVASPFYEQLGLVGFLYPRPWTLATNDGDDFAVANLGQLKNAFSFDLTKGSRLVAPSALTAKRVPTGVSLTWSAPPTTASGNFQVARWGPLAAGPPTLIIRPGTSRAFVDSSVSPGGTYLYRVRYSIAGALSAPTNTVAISITGGPVIDPGPGSGGSDGGSGSGDDDSGGPDYDPEEADSDGDGIPDFGESADGTDPNSSDTDGDGKPDSDDKYPKDTRRSRDVPVITYAAIDISSEYTDKVEQIALGDDDSLACWYVEPASGDYGVIYWLRSVTQHYTVNKSVFQEYNGEQRSFQLTAKSVSAQGVLTGTATTQMEGELKTLIFHATQNAMAPSQSVIAFSSETSEIFRGATANGSLWSTTKQAHGYPRNNSQYYSTKDFTVTKLASKTFPTYSSVFDSGTPQSEWVSPSDSAHYKFSWEEGLFSPIDITTISSSATAAVGQYEPPNQSLTHTISNGTDGPPGLVLPLLPLPPYKSPKQLKLWTQDMETGEERIVSLFSGNDPDTQTVVQAVGDKGTVVADSSYFTDHSTNAPPGAKHLAVFVNGSAPQDIYSLVPTYLTQQVKFERALSISSDNHILLNGSVLKGEPAEWANCQFIIDPSYSTLQVVGAHFIPDGATEPVSVGAAKTNKKKSLAATASTSTTSGSISRALFLIPIEFVTSDCTKGFDYPLQGDPPNSPNWNGPHGGILDEEQPEWWTSVGQGLELSKNEHVVADIGDATNADWLTIRVQPEDTWIVDMEPEILDGKETHLVLQGKATPGGTNKWANIEIIEKSGEKVLRTLDVAALLERDLPVRICYVYDPRHNLQPGTDGTQNSTKVRDSLQITEDIVAHLNRTFRQACVQFYATSDSGSVAVNYDEDGGRDLDFVNGDLTNSIELRAFVESGLFNESVLTVFVVSRFQKYLNTNSTRAQSSFVGISASSGGQTTRWTFVDSEAFVSGGGPISIPI